jgi:pyruvate,water dikinase
MEQALILPLGASNVSLALGGGKGSSLAQLIRAGFPVPGGFLITTHAYHLYVVTHNLEEWILQTAKSASSDDPAKLEEVSAAIRKRFAAGSMPSTLTDSIRKAYAGLGEPPVAVRSSATTEDLPEASFAGQHDTFLNIVGSEALLDAVVRCWSSLWTARAIGYRVRNRIGHMGATLAVAIQEMVHSEAAGVLFTANPLTGKRTETVIDASLGLGETLVSGQVEPDHYSVDVINGRILNKTRGTKAIALHGKPGGGTMTFTEDASDRQALPDSVIIELSALGSRVARLFGAPQDIEWAWTDGKLYVLQSRAITSLFPVPEGLESESLQVLVSFGAVQGMLDPMTPLGRDVFRYGAASVSTLIGHTATLDSQPFFLVAAERLFINVTGAVRDSHARHLVRKALKMVEPRAGQALELALDDPQLAPQNRPVRLGVLAKIIPLPLRIIGNIGYNLLRPDAGRLRIQRRIQAALMSFQVRSTAAKTLADRVALFEAAVESVGEVGPVIAAGLASGLGALQLLGQLVADLPDEGPQLLETTRGLPHNVTTEMDLALWQTAVAINADPAASAHFRHGDAATLAAEVRAGESPAAAQAAVDQFLRLYGMRGIAEIDIGRPRWREDPTQLIQVLQSYFRIEDPDKAPNVVFERGAASARATIASLIDAVHHTRFGWVKSRLARWAARRMRALAGLRESPKFTVIRLLGILREGLLASGRELVEAGLLARPEEIFFLHLDEIRDVAGGVRRDSRELIGERRDAYDREKRRRWVPRLLLSDGRAFFEGVAEPPDENDAALVGSPVSPGVVEGVVHVVFDPHAVQLALGEILVCPGTDPAWTPLFLAAGGLVMEVGGLMTHGSVVAREYGIPAVVGVYQATKRLRTGQRVCVDGSQGKITIL